MNKTKTILFRIYLSVLALIILNACLFAFTKMSFAGYWSNYVYRIPYAKIEDLYSFKSFKIKDEVVSFYTNHQKRFRRVDFSTYMTKRKYTDLIGKNKDYIDITSDKIKKFNNGKYVILEKLEGSKRLCFIAQK